MIAFNYLCVKSSHMYSYLANIYWKIATILKRTYDTFRPHYKTILIIFISSHLMFLGLVNWPLVHSYLELQAHYWMLITMISTSRKCQYGMERCVVILQLSIDHGFRTDSSVPIRKSDRFLEGMVMCLSVLQEDIIVHMVVQMIQWILGALRSANIFRNIMLKRYCRWSNIYYVENCIICCQPIVSIGSWSPSCTIIHHRWKMSQSC